MVECGSFSWMSGFAVSGQDCTIPFRLPDKSHPRGFVSFPPFRRHRVVFRNEWISASRAATFRKEGTTSKTDQFLSPVCRNITFGRTANCVASSGKRVVGP